MKNSSTAPDENFQSMAKPTLSHRSHLAAQSTKLRAEAQRLRAVTASLKAINASTRAETALCLDHFRSLRQATEKVELKGYSYSHRQLGQTELIALTTKELSTQREPSCEKAVNINPL
jgi:hypothetical protein